MERRSREIEKRGDIFKRDSKKNIDTSKNKDIVEIKKNDDLILQTKEKEDEKEEIKSEFENKDGDIQENNNFINYFSEDNRNFNQDTDRVNENNDYNNDEDFKKSITEDFFLSSDNFNQKKNNNNSDVLDDLIKNKLENSSQNNFGNYFNSNRKTENFEYDDKTRRDINNFISKEDINIISTLPNTGFQVFPGDKNQDNLEYSGSNVTFNPNFSSNPLLNSAYEGKNIQGISYNYAEGDDIMMGNNVNTDNLNDYNNNFSFSNKVIQENIINPSEVFIPNITTKKKKISDNFMEGDNNDGKIKFTGKKTLRSRNLDAPIKTEYEKLAQISVYKYADRKNNSRKKLLSSISNKKSKKTSKSKKQALIDELVKDKSIKTKEDAKAFMERKNYQFDDQEINYYYNLFLTKFQGKKISLVKNIINKPIIVPFVTIASLPYVTSDSLYWNHLLYNDLLKVIKKNNINERLIECVSIDSIGVYSLLIIENTSKVKLREYYSQDMDVDFSCPGFREGYKVTEKDLTESKSSNSFSLNGKTYKKWDLEVKKNEKIVSNLEVFAIENYKANELAEKLNKIKLVKAKSFLSSGFKTYNKDVGYYYYSAEFKPTNFCPAFVEYPFEFEDGEEDQNMEARVVYYLKIDPSILFDKCVADKIFYSLDNFITLDNLNSFMQFFLILKISCPELQENSLKLINDSYEFYSANKSIFVAYKTHYKMFKSIVLTFYDLFDTKINIDKVKSIFGKTVLYEEDEKELTNSKTHTYYFQMCKVLENYNKYWKNWAISIGQDSALYLVRLIKILCVKLLNPSSDSDSLIRYCRFCGVAIQKVFVDGSNPMISETRSPCSYMVNTIGEESINLIGEKVEILKRQIEEDGMKKFDQAQNQIKALKYSTEAMNKLIANAYNNLVNNNKDNELIKTYGNDLQNIFNSVRQEVLSQSEVLRKNIEDNYKKSLNNINTDSNNINMINTSSSANVSSNNDNMDQN